MSGVRPSRGFRSSVILDGNGRGERKRTEGFPALAEALVVDRIDDVDDRVAVAVIFRPNGPDSALASEIPELQHGRGQRYLPSCTKRKKVWRARVYDV